MHFERKEKKKGRREGEKNHIKGNSKRRKSNKPLCRCFIYIFNSPLVIISIAAASRKRGRRRKALKQDKKEGETRSVVWIDRGLYLSIIIIAYYLNSSVQL